MARNGAISRKTRQEKRMERFDLSCSNNSLRVEAHVLAVDDSLVDRKVIEKLLKISSCKVTTVDSGRRALQFLGLDEEEKEKDKEEVEEKKSCVVEDGLKIDLIITDYCMPEMTGYELLKKIKESSVFRETPVVIMSSENVLARIHRCLEEGAEDFIVKPVKLSDVKRLIECMTAMREDGSKMRTKPVVTTDNNNKRKQPDGAELSTSSASSEILSSLVESSSETSPSPSVSISSSPSQSPLQSPLLVFERPLDSPTRRMKQNVSDSDQMAPAAAAASASSSSPS